MVKTIHCNGCSNPFGLIEQKVIEINTKRVKSVKYDFKEKKVCVKCRTCSLYSNLSFEDKLVNEVDYKRTAGNLLG